MLPFSRPRRTISLIVVLGALIAADARTAVGTQDATFAPATPPNIVVIMTDDQRWDTLWSMPRVQELLVKPGVTFTEAFAVNPICCPSRASFLTGNYSHTTGVYTNTAWHGSFDAFNDKTTLATMLDPTYETGFFGKYLNRYRGPGKRGYVPPGWDEWNAFLRGSYRGFSYSVNGTFEDHAGDGTYSTDDLAARADAFIRGASTEPLFLYFAPLAPHAPAIPDNGDGGLFKNLPPWRPPSYNEANVSDKPPHRYLDIPPMSAKQKRKTDRFRIDQLRTLRSVDRAVDTIVQALEDTGKLDNTFILFTTDNGHFWGEHRYTGKNMAYEEAIRLPFVVRYDPEVVDPGSKDGHIVTNIDLAPTATALAGVPAPPMEGRTLMPLLQHTVNNWRDLILIEHAQRSHGNPSFCQVHGTRFTFVAYADNTYEFYDLHQDPFEMRNAHREPQYRKEEASLRAATRHMCHPVPPGFPRTALDPEIIPPEPTPTPEPSPSPLAEPSP